MNTIFNFRKKLNLKNVFLFFAPLITPILLLSIPGYVLLFYYQIHIGNLPSFLTQINTSIFILLGIVSIFFYIFLLLYGMISSFWLYTIINFLIRKITKANVINFGNVIPNKNFEFSLYFIFSILLNLFFVFDLYEIQGNSYIISFGIYFFIVGFFLLRQLIKYLNTI